MRHFIILIFLISFASINAVFYTPVLPQLALVLHITESAAQATMLSYLVGYTIGQLLYGPLANRFGRKRALLGGILLQIISSLLCAESIYLSSFNGLILGRFFLALGAGVGLKMSFTYIHELYPSHLTQRITSCLILSFAFLPGLSVALCGSLLPYLGSVGCFYVTALYGVVIGCLCLILPETRAHHDLQALTIRQLVAHYGQAAKNYHLWLGGVSLGLCSAFIYGYAVLAPFIAITQHHLSATTYGFYNGLPTLGMVLGAMLSITLSYALNTNRHLQLGVVIVCIGTLGLWLGQSLPLLYGLFIPAGIINVGLSLIFPAGSTLALQAYADKAHGSAFVSFINMAFATLVVGLLQSILLNFATLLLLFTALTFTLLSVEGIKMVKSQLP